MTNQDRIDNYCRVTQYPFSETNQAFKDGGLEAFKAKADHCPACIMSALMQGFDGDLENWIAFDYKK